MSSAGVNQHKPRSKLSRSSPRYYTLRSQWSGLWISAEQLENPKIAVVNSSSLLSPFFSHLDGVAQQVIDAVRQENGLGFEIRTVAPSDFQMSAGAEDGYVLASRDLISYDIEAVVEGAQLDAMICLASCDKTAPGQIMAALRTNVPTIVVSCGYQACGQLNGRNVDIEEAFISASHLARGGITTSELDQMCDVAVESPGVCAGIGTANTMHMTAEVMRFAELGSTPGVQNSQTIKRCARNSAHLIMNAIKSGVRPRVLVTLESIRNAVKVVLASGGSLNAIKYLQAFVFEADENFNVDQIFREEARTCRPIVAVRPNGPYRVTNFDKAGGTASLMKTLSADSDLTATDAVGIRLASKLKSVPQLNAAIPGIGTIDAPFSDNSTIAAARGNLAPGYGLLKLTVGETRTSYFQRPAMIYTATKDAISALNKGMVKRGSVLVLCGLGPRGTPGMGVASNIVFAIDGAGLTNKVAFITDGQFSGLVNKGIAVGEIYPEGTAKTPLAIVQDGDEISLDFKENPIHLHISNEKLNDRLAEQSAPPKMKSRRFLDLFAESYEEKYFSSVIHEEFQNIGEDQ